MSFIFVFKLDFLFFAFISIKILNFFEKWFSLEKNDKKIQKNKKHAFLEQISIMKPFYLTFELIFHDYNILSHLVHVFALLKLLFLQLTRSYLCFHWNKNSDKNKFCQSIMYQVVIYNSTSFRAIRKNTKSIATEIWPTEKSIQSKEKKIIHS